MKTFITLWKLQLKDRLPVLQEDLQEAVYLPPRLVYGVYNVLILLYWTAVAAGSIVWLAGRYTYSLGVSTRLLLAPPQPLQLKPSEKRQETKAQLKPTQKPTIPAASVPSPQTPLLPAVEKISLTQLTTSAAQKVKAANPNMIVLARPWGKGWRIAVLEPDKAMSIQPPWKLVVRS